MEAEPAEEALLASAEEPHKIEGNCIEISVKVVTAECEKNHRSENSGLPSKGSVGLKASLGDVFSPTKGLLSPMKGLVVASPPQQQRSDSPMALNGTVLAAFSAAENPQAIVSLEKRDVALQTDPELELNSRSVYPIRFFGMAAHVTWL